jgi:hypothetical protein
MNKDGLAEKVRNDLRQLYNRITEEDIPQDMQRLLDKLK